MNRYASSALCALLAACGTPGDGPGAGTPDSASPSGDAGADAAAGTPDFLGSLKMGINIERANAYNMGDFATGTTAFTYLKGLGFTHVRLFYAFRPTINFGQSAGLGIAPTKAEFSRILPVIHHAHEVGLKVVLDLTDVMGTEDFAGANQALVDGYLDMASKAIADEHFDPNLLAVGAVNEWAGGDNPTYNAQRQHVLGILRANLPGFVLTTGASTWKYYGDLMKDDFQLSDDKLVIYDIHAYEDDANNASHWTDLTAKIAAWSAAHGGAQVMFGEAGFGGGFDGGPSVYYNALSAAADHGEALRPMFWAITNGSAWRMNRSDSDYHLDAALEYVMNLHHP